jgi:hypothetical protein
VLQQFLKADHQPHRKRRDGIIARLRILATTPPMRAPSC